MREFIFEFGRDIFCSYNKKMLARTGGLMRDLVGVEPAAKSRFLI
jgi:hypothetical protein